VRLVAIVVKYSIYSIALLQELKTRTLLNSRIKRGKQTFLRSKGNVLRISGKTDHHTRALPIMAYTDRLYPKEIPFSGFRYMKGKGFWKSVI